MTVWTWVLSCRAVAVRGREEREERNDGRHGRDGYGRWREGHLGVWRMKTGFSAIGESGKVRLK